MVMAGEDGARNRLLARLGKGMIGVVCDVRADGRR